MALVAALHIFVSIALVVFVLLQNPKGGAMGILGGMGSSKSVFGSTGADDFLVTTTKWCALIFACTSITLAYMNTKKGSSVILDSPAAETPAPAPAPAPSPSSPAQDQ